MIRELVQTERSYARHLESLMQAVRRLSNPQIANAKRDRRGQAESTVAPHIMSLRSLLPQLIALSRALTSRIDEDPTAAGVGAAFRVIAPQLEATFVGWSFTVADIQNALRISEGTKSKSKDRIGLVYLSAQESTLPRAIGHARSPSVPSTTMSSRRASYGPSAGLPDIDDDELEGKSAADDSMTELARPRVLPSSRSASSLGFANATSAFGRKAFGAAVRKVSDTASPPLTFKSTQMKALSPLDIVIMP